MITPPAVGIPFWRLSSFYFFYFALLGAWLPFWNLYLVDSGFGDVAVGGLAAIVMGSKIFAPTVWGAIAERSGRRNRCIQYGCGLALLALLPLLLQPALWLMALVILLFSFFWNAVLPQFEVVTFDHLARHYHHYSNIRLWGSVGFILAVLGLGELFTVFSIQWLPVLLLLISAGLLISSLTVPSAVHHKTETATTPLRFILRKPAVMAFFVVVALQQFAHGPYYTFFSIYLQDLGYSTASIGGLWSLGVMAEIVLFLFMHRLLPRYGIRAIIGISLALSVLRWLLLGYYADSGLLLMLFIQVLHAASFGACHAVAIEFVRQHFGNRQSIGQALYSGASFGLGGALGAVVSGLVWHYGAAYSFTLAALSSLVAMVLALVYILPVSQAATGAAPGTEIL